MSNSKDEGVILKLDEILNIDRGKVSRIRMDAAEALVKNLVSYDSRYLKESQIYGFRDNNLFYNADAFKQLHREIGELLEKEELNNDDKKLLSEKIYKLKAMTTNLESRYVSLQKESQTDEFKQALPWGHYIERIFSAMRHVIDLEKSITNDLAKKVNALVRPTVAPRPESAGVRKNREDITEAQISTKEKQRPNPPIPSPRKLTFGENFTHWSNEVDEVKRAIEKATSAKELEGSREKALKILYNIRNLEKEAEKKGVPVDRLPSEVTISGGKKVNIENFKKDIHACLERIDKKNFEIKLDKAQSAFKAISNRKYFKKEDAADVKSKISELKTAIFANWDAEIKSGRAKAGDQPTGNFKIALEALGELSKRVSKAEKSAKIFQRATQNNVVKQMRAMTGDATIRSAFESVINKRGIEIAPPKVTIGVAKN